MIHKVINPVRLVRHNSLPDQYKKNKFSTNDISVSKIVPYISYRNSSNSTKNIKNSNAKLNKIIKTGISSFENLDQVNNEEFIMEEKTPIIVALNDNEIINKESYKEKKKIIKKLTTELKTKNTYINKQKSTLEELNNNSNELFNLIRDTSEVFLYIFTDRNSI